MRASTVWLACFPALSALLALGDGALGRGPARRGVYRTGFEGAEALKAWEGSGDPHVRLVPGWNGSQSSLSSGLRTKRPGSRNIRCACRGEAPRGRVKVEPWSRPTTWPSRPPGTA